MRYLAVLVLIAPLYGAISVNGTGTTTGGTNVSSLTWSHTVAAGTNRLLVVSVGHYFTFPTVGTISSITFGGVALTQKAKVSVVGDADTHEIWTLASPAVSTANIVVTFSATQENAIAGAIAFTGSTGSLTTTTPVSALSASTLSVTTGATANYGYASYFDWTDSAWADGTSTFNNAGVGGAYTSGAYLTGANPVVFNTNNSRAILIGMAIQEGTDPSGSRKRVVITQ
jgi:hypothetical protein